MNHSPSPRVCVRRETNDNPSMVPVGTERTVAGRDQRSEG